MSNYLIHNDDCLKVLDRMPPNTIDCVITDPPYEMNFMGKGWDNAGVSFDKTTWQKCLKVLKPGGYLVAFGGTRTYHRIACAIEDAGFEIRDCIMWLYGSGFPKSHNIGLSIDKLNGCPDRGHRIATANRYHPDGTLEPNGEKLKPYETKTEEAHKWNGWGTALKPSYEPIIVARKPIEGTVAKNCLKYGVGGLNIDECRVAFNGDMWKTQKSGSSSRAYQSEETTTAGGMCIANNLGRFPANTILDTGEGEEWRRYFYCAKASKKDRDEGLEELEEKKTGELQGGRKEGSAGSIMLNENGTTRVNPYAGTGAPKKNSHPTVKPTALMQYLIRLVAPKGATILDPFMGSGSTGKAVIYENKERNAGYNFIGIEKDAEYCKIAEARIKQTGGEE